MIFRHRCSQLFQIILWRDRLAFANQLLSLPGFCQGHAYIVFGRQSNKKIATQPPRSWLRPPYFTNSQAPSCKSFITFLNFTSLSTRPSL